MGHLVAQGLDHLILVGDERIELRQAVVGHQMPASLEGELGGRYDVDLRGDLPVLESTFEPGVPLLERDERGLGDRTGQGRCGACEDERGFRDAIGEGRGDRPEGGPGDPRHAECGGDPPTGEPTPASALRTSM